MLKIAKIFIELQIPITASGKTEGRKRARKGYSISDCWGTEHKPIFITSG